MSRENMTSTLKTITEPITNVTPRADLLILGMSRGGTTWMSMVLNGHPDAAVIGETGFWGKAYLTPNAQGQYDKDQLIKLRYHMLNTMVNTCGGEGGMIGETPGKLKRVTPSTWVKIVEDLFGEVKPGVRPGDVFQKLCFAVAQMEGKVHCIEKTPHHINWTDRILREMPNTQMIVMVRGPYSFMRSYKHQADRREGDSAKSFKRLYHPIGCALVWRSYWRSISALKKRHPENTLIIEHERIKSDPNIVAVEAQKHFGLNIIEDLASRVSQVNSSFPGNSSPNLSSGDLFWMRFVCKKEILDSGHDIQPFVSKISDLKNLAYTFFSAVPWACRAMLAMRKMVKGNYMAYALTFFKNKDV